MSVTRHLTCGLRLQFSRPAHICLVEHRTNLWSHSKFRTQRLYCTANVSEGLARTGACENTGKCLTSETQKREHSGRSVYCHALKLPLVNVQMVKPQVSFGIENVEQRSFACSVTRSSVPSASLSVQMPNDRNTLFSNIRQILLLINNQQKTGFWAMKMQI